MNAANAVSAHKPARRAANREHNPAVKRAASLAHSARKADRKAARSVQNPGLNVRNPGLNVRNADHRVWNPGLNAWKADHSVRIVVLSALKAARRAVRAEPISVSAVSVLNSGLSALANAMSNPQVARIAE
jgi:hypothetical protein